MPPPTSIGLNFGNAENHSAPDATPHGHESSLASCPDGAAVSPTLAPPVLPVSATIASTKTATLANRHGILTRYTPEAGAARRTERFVFRQILPVAPRRSLADATQGFGSTPASA